MQMKDPLPTTPLHVEHQFVSGFVDTPPLGYITSGHDHSGYDVTVLVGQVVNAADVPAGNDQLVNWSVRVDVFEHYQIIVFIRKPGIGPACGDVAENAVRFHAPILPVRINTLYRCTVFIEGRFVAYFQHPSYRFGKPGSDAAITP
jgi:hypothetical protein